jgi:uncharacterized protein (DUF885 family)
MTIPVAGDADRGGNAAVHARADVGFDGYAGSLRKGGEGGVLQRHAAGEDMERGETEDYMRSFNRGTIASTAIHEAFPGHYVQFLWMPNAPSKVRKLISANTYVEGWAHYCEQMMIDEGYGGGDPKAAAGPVTGCAAAQCAFHRRDQDAHRADDFRAGVDFFVKEGYQTKITGERETKRGTSDPTYLYYTLGKLEILKLREDYKKMRGLGVYDGGVPQ